jgi:hypothetical protein
MDQLVPHEVIADRIHVIREKRAMLDRDLAKLYGVTTGNLNKAVKRNMDRFPEDFMFRLTSEEHKALVFQSGIPKRGGTRFLPYAFTEPGVAMLSSVLNSDRAVQVNIQIMRAFIRLREMLTANEALRYAIEGLERRVSKNERNIGIAIKAIQGLLNPPSPVGPKRRMGFGPPTKGKK